ncbi:RNF219 [Bugula neritina]|uniref:RNF219 n=1 Tax=Bugula neritina TaxID=10212 RepID=A0A7J7KRV0_BUGNE|nr:RNF219 [Bugula neritina]
MTSTVAMTLPILCQICLGKVREPVSCNNNHVYCKACIIIWTSKNKHCPTCRVEITAEQPFRLLLGGQNVETSESPAFAEPMNRKARVKSLFNSYEAVKLQLLTYHNQDEIQRLNDIIVQLEEEIRSLKDVAPATVSPTPSMSGSSLCESDRQSLGILKSKLAEATQLQHKVNLELRGYQQENNDLKQANIDLSRENDQLRYDLSQRTPSKIGRFTVAALESQIEKQKKEICNLKKALSVSDNHIQALETRLKLANQSKLQTSLTNDMAATCNAPGMLNQQLALTFS